MRNASVIFTSQTSSGHREIPKCPPDKTSSVKFARKFANGKSGTTIHPTGYFVSFIKELRARMVMVFREPSAISDKEGDLSKYQETRFMIFQVPFAYHINPCPHMLRESVNQVCPCSISPYLDRTDSRTISDTEDKYHTAYLSAHPIGTSEGRVCHPTCNTDWNIVLKL